MQRADLSRLPDVFDRLRADTDFREAVELRRQAQKELRWKCSQWAYEHRRLMRRAIRAWQRYATQVRRFEQ